MSDEAVAAQRPIIIIKKKKAGHAHHGGAWKVAFADFMTAMFALFLVLWILTQSQEVKSAVANYFRHPTDYEGKPDSNLHGNNGLMESRQGRMDNISNVLQIEIKKETSDGAGQTPESIAGGSAPATAEAGLRPEIIERVEEQEKDEMRSFVKIADDLWMILGMDPSFKRFKDNIMMESMEDGLVIQLVEQLNCPLLEDGGLEFKPSIKKALSLLGRELAKYPNKLEIDGHAADISHLSGGTKKWVGSSMLADLARGELESAGLKPGQVTKVAGCADARPLNPRTSSDPLNRRVSILVRPRQWHPERY